MPDLTIHRESWPLRQAFTISRGSRTSAEVLVAEIRDGEFRGRGECVPYARYGESLDSVSAQMQSFWAALGATPDRDQLRCECPAGAARNAIDCALWDLEAKRAGMRCWQLADLPTPTPTITVETISLDTPSAMANCARQAAERPALKIKLDGEAVVERVAAVHRAAPGAELVVDANEAWTPELLRSVVPALADLGVTMIEQPLPADDDRALAGFNSPIPICADESCHLGDDLAELRERYTMVNIKLDKTGGLTEALELRAAAKHEGFAVMIGCMVGTSLAMAPATLLTSGAAVVDLDGPLWMTNDREPGLDFTDSRVHPPSPALWG